MSVCEREVRRWSGKCVETRDVAPAAGSASIGARRRRRHGRARRRASERRATAMDGEETVYEGEWMVRNQARKKPSARVG